jgi:hypothetical protein
MWGKKFNTMLIFVEICNFFLALLPGLTIISISLFIPECNRHSACHGLSGDILIRCDEQARAL